MAAIILTPNIRKVYINKTNHSKMLHLVVEINQALFEGLVEIGVSMSIMVASVVKELGSCIWFQGMGPIRSLQA